MEDKKTIFEEDDKAFYSNETLGREGLHLLVPDDESRPVDTVMGSLEADHVLTPNPSLFPNVGRLVPIGAKTERRQAVDPNPIDPSPPPRKFFNPLTLEEQLAIIVNWVMENDSAACLAVEEIAYRWHKGRLAAEDKYYKDVDPKDFGHDEENLMGGKEDENKIKG